MDCRGGIAGAFLCPEGAIALQPKVSTLGDHQFLCFALYGREIPWAKSDTYFSTKTECGPLPGIGEEKDSAGQTNDDCFGHYTNDFRA